MANLFQFGFFAFCFFCMTTLLQLGVCLAYTIGVRKGVVDERLNVAQINIGRAPSGGSNNFNLREFTYDCLKVLNGFIHFIANMAKEAILETSTDFYAVPAETESAILTLSSANHINKYHHCEMYTHSKSQFTRDFNLTKVFFTKSLKKDSTIVMVSFIFTSLMSIGSSDTFFRASPISRHQSHAWPFACLAFCSTDYRKKRDLACVAGAWK